MTSPYTLGDIKLLDIGNLNTIENLIVVEVVDDVDVSTIDDTVLVSYYPNDTIGYRYINKKFDYPELDNIQLFYESIIEHIKAKLSSFPEYIYTSTSIVTSLQVGDIIGGSTWHIQTKRPLVINEKDLASQSLESIIGEAHTQSESFEYSYIDLDLCCAVLATTFNKPFNQRVDDFSNLIILMRNILNVVTTDDTRESLIIEIQDKQNPTN